MLVHTDERFKAEVEELSRVKGDDLLDLAFNANDAKSLSALIRGSHVAQKVKRVLYYVTRVMRGVTGSDSERWHFHSYSQIKPVGWCMLDELNQ